VSFDTPLRGTQSTVGNSRLSAKRIEACGYCAVSFDTPLRGTQSTGRFSRLSAKRTEACDMVLWPSIQSARADHSVHGELKQADGEAYRSLRLL
jgi:uncharacterized protein YfcZ (UPF0381/DUF406 family)